MLVLVPTPMLVLLVCEPDFPVLVCVCQTSLCSTNTFVVAYSKLCFCHSSCALVAFCVCPDATALCVLSAGTDRSFRVFHTVRDCLSQELSQKPLVKVGAERVNDSAEMLPAIAVVRTARKN